MNGLVILLLVFLIPTDLYSQGDVINDDNFSLQIDKPLPHLTTSFGLYFMFHTLYQDSLLFTLHDSIPIPLHSMEIIQPQLVLYMRFINPHHIVEVMDSVIMIWCIT